MDSILTLFGQGHDLSPLQMGLRAFSLYLIAVALIRISGRRTFGKKTSYDNVVVILLGAILSRAVVGASPYWSTVAAALVLVSLHRILAWLSLSFHGLGQLIKGKEMLLYRNGQFNSANMKKCLISEGDLQESLRLSAHTNSFDHIKEIYMEKSGQVSFIKTDA